MSELTESVTRDTWRDFAGVRVIGDVHGDLTAFATAIDGARTAGRFVVQLGDLVDRGPDSPGTLRLALGLIERGEGLFLRSNHDDKLRRALRGNPVRIGTELRRTMAGIEAAPDHEMLLPRVLASLEEAPWWLRIGDHCMVHAAFHPAMLTASDPKELTPRRVADKCRWLALHGEGRAGDDDDALPVRTYGWIDTVPAGLTVLIGHDAISTENIIERHGAAGGRVLFCDTGCGKGGKLSWIDFAPDLHGEGNRR